MFIKTLFPSFIFALLCGCSAPSASHMAVSTVSFAGTVATKVTVTAVKTTGEIAVATTKTTVHTAGSVVSSVSHAGFVTIKDTATGVSRQIPYREGLRLYAASQTAKVDMALKSFQLIRSGTPVLTARWSRAQAATVNDPVLHAGDVIQVSSVSPKTARNARPGKATAKRTI